MKFRCLEVVLHFFLAATRLNYTSEFAFYLSRQNFITMKSTSKPSPESPPTYKTPTDAVEDADDATNINEEGPKRHTACETCRKRKLKCSGDKPKCESCTRLKKECTYTVIHKKSGPPRGYLKTLESRLEQMEKLLAASIDVNSNGTKRDPSMTQKRHFQEEDNFVGRKRPSKAQSFMDEDDDVISTLPPVSLDLSAPQEQPPTNCAYQKPSDTMFSNSQSSLIPMDLEEPYPTDDVVERLVENYFEVMHPFYPFINKHRFYSTYSSGKMKPHLLYAILMTGASLSDTPLFHLQEEMYLRCVKYVNKSEMKDFGREILTLEYIQANLLLSVHENRIGCFPRAWITIGKTIRAVNQCNLHDTESGAGRKHRMQCLSDKPEVGPLYMEEKRRTFWSVYVLDKYYSAASGWPSGLRDEDIKTCIPLNDSAFNENLMGQSVSFTELLKNPQLYVKETDSSLAFSVLLSYYTQQAFELKSRPNQFDDSSASGSWWTAEQQLAQSLSALNTVLPKVTMQEESTPGANMAISIQLFYHVAVLATNQSALDKLKSCGGPFAQAEFKIRCQQTTTNIARVMRMASNLFKMVLRNPCGLYCVYAAVKSILSLLEEEHSIYVYSGTDTDKSHVQTLHAQLRPQLDFLMTVLKVLRPKMFMAECFYEKALMEVKHAKILRTPGGAGDYIDELQRESNKTDAALAKRTMDELINKRKWSSGSNSGLGFGLGSNPLEPFSLNSNSPDSSISPASTASSTLRAGAASLTPDENGTHGNYASKPRQHLPTDSAAANGFQKEQSGVPNCVGPGINGNWNSSNGPSPNNVTSPGFAVPSTPVIPPCPFNEPNDHDRPQAKAQAQARVRTQASASSSSSPATSIPSMSSACSAPTFSPASLSSFDAADNSNGAGANQPPPNMFSPAPGGGAPPNLDFLEGLDFFQWNSELTLEELQQQL